MKLNAHILSRRKQMCLTQMQLARALGHTTPQFVSNCDRNRCTYPVKSFIKLSKTLNISLDKLLFLRVQDYKLYLRRRIK